MRDCSVDNAINSLQLVVPSKERLHLCFNSHSRWRLKVNLLATESRWRDYLHRSPGIIAPRSDPDRTHSRTPCREKRRLPAEKPLCRYWRDKILGGVERHLYN